MSLKICSNTSKKGFKSLVFKKEVDFWQRKKFDSKTKKMLLNDDVEKIMLTLSF